MQSSQRPPSIHVDYQHEVCCQLCRLQLRDINIVTKDQGCFEIYKMVYFKLHRPGSWITHGLHSKPYCLCLGCVPRESGVCPKLSCIGGRTSKMMFGCSTVGWSLDCTGHAKRWLPPQHLLQVSETTFKNEPRRLAAPHRCPTQYPIRGRRVRCAQHLPHAAASAQRTCLPRSHRHRRCLRHQPRLPLFLVPIHPASRHRHR